jgi:hypothetical protein
MIMAKTIKRILKRLIRTEKGQSLTMVLILLAVGGLIIAPLLSYTSSGLKVGKAYEKMADEFYAADAGIGDGLWQIKYNHLEELFSSYQRYNYSAVYEYPISYPVEVNDMDVDISIENVWIPKDLPAPTNAEAENLIGAGKLIIAGGVSAELTQQVKIYYYQGATDPPLFVNKIGIWLPPGISYDTAGLCTLETWLTSESKAYTRNITPHQGGQAVVWTLAQPLPFTDLPGVSILDTPMASTFIFHFFLNDPESERTPEALSWITTSGVSDIPYTWDADVRVFHINSQAGGADGTTIDAYSIRSELRELGSAINGDYRAIGSTLMIDTNPWSTPPRLDELLDYSDATVNDIPENAQVDKAYLYWSGWLLAGDQYDTLFYDSCNDIDNGNWYAGSDWRNYQSGQTRAFQAHHLNYGGTELEMIDTLSLGMYDPGTVTISWRYWLYQRNIESGDCLQYAFRKASGWSSWNTVFCDDSYGGASTTPQTFETAIPDQYLTDNFRIKFRITGFNGSNEIVYIDDIKVLAKSETAADTSVAFKIDGDQVYFADDEYGNPTVPTIGTTQKIIASRSQMLENRPNEYSYSCKKDVTGLLQTFTDHGNATYTVGNVDGDTGNEWSYAAWSLIIIYSSPDTKGHQLYLYDDFLYVDNNGTLEYPISGFLVPDPIAGEADAAKITCFVGEGDDYYADDYIALNPPSFPHAPDSCKLWDGTTSTSHPGSNTKSHPNNVWNSKSIGLAETGIDIDTFSVSWASGLLEPGDSSALVALETGTDSWNLVYIIISFRSRSITGGTVTYLIEG